MRRPPSGPAPNLDRKSDLGQIIMTRRYELITPLFGGGVKAGKVDLQTPVRGSTIRGQLRFWWRATQGGRFDGDLAEMKQAEDEIWGSTESASKVTIAVKTISIGSDFVVPYTDQDGNRRSIGDPGSVYGYVGFPLRQENGVVRDGVSFELDLEFPLECRSDVMAALWAWETFGGVGARTRRGFGALSCQHVQFKPGSAEEDPAAWSWLSDSRHIQSDLKKQVDTFVSGGKFPAGVPHLSHHPARYRIRATNHDRDPYTAWEDLIRALKAFRQNRSGNRGFGRSKWPEPDAIRDITGQDGSRFRHNVPVHGSLIKKFPRAQFGLPIIFEFHPRQTHPSKSDFDPRRTTLVGVNVNRLASPLIIRSLNCSDRTVGLAAVLEGPRPSQLGGLALKEGSESGTTLAAPLSEKFTLEEAKLVSSKHDYYDGSADILQSFLNNL